MVPCSVMAEAGLQFYGRNINDTFTHTVFKGGEENCCRTVAHAVAYSRFTKRRTPFFFFFAFPMTEKYT